MRRRGRGKEEEEEENKKEEDANSTQYARWCSQTCLYLRNVMSLFLHHFSQLSHYFLCGLCRQVDKPQTVKHCAKPQIHTLKADGGVLYWQM